MNTQSCLWRSVFGNGLLVTASLCLMQVAQAQTPAGKVVFAQGTPVAVNTAGTERGLARGNEIFSGDRLITDNGRLQLSMADGAFISVQPESEYQVENYNYSGTPDGSEIANYRLVKGGVRAVTGLIGRQNPEAYKVNTAVATIGIRGTGHNTRICQGDCPGREDGLYHNTWEGITFVVNDVDAEDVPAGNGVYVQDIESEIQLLDQPPAILAVEIAREQREQEQEESEEEGRIISTGEQRDQTGDQQIVVAARNEQPDPEVEPEPGPEPEPVPVPVPVPVVPVPTASSTVITNVGLLGVIPDAEAPEDVGIISFRFDSSVFRRDSDNKGVGIFGFEEEDTTEFRTLATIDVAAVRGGNNTAAVSGAEALLSGVSQSLFDTLAANPATPAEFFYNGEIGFFRWTSGNILVMHDNQPAHIETLNGFQSIHFLFGSEPTVSPISGNAKYVFFDGTQTTSVSGSTIGQGVLSGFINVNFVNSTATLDMDVSHDGILYDVSGNLFMGSGDGYLSDIVNSVPSVFASGGGCYPYSCPTVIEAGFAGPTESSGSFPKHLAMEFDIQTPDVIMGVAWFGYEPPPPASSFVKTGAGFVAVSPDTTAIDNVDITQGFDAAMFLDANDQMVGTLFSEEDGGPLLRIVSTIDLDAMLGGDDPTSTAEVQSLLNMADTGVVATFQAGSPATVADTFFNSGLGYGRWTGGSILTFDDTGSTGTGIRTLTGNQSIHYIFGEDPGPIITSGTASYTLTGGTSSTSVSGSTLGSGATSGLISVDFSAGTGNINMTVDHIPGFAYTVFGTLNISGIDNMIIDNAVTASTSAAGSACNSVCVTFIDGGFAGPSNLGTPGHIGIEYDIQDTDVVTGVAGFHEIGDF